MTSRAEAATMPTVTLRGAHWALEATTDCVAVLDRDFRFIYGNRQMMAVPRATHEVVGLTYWTVWPEMCGTEVERRLRMAMIAGEAQHFEYQFECPLGERWLDMHLYPSPEGLAIFFRDVTDLRTHESREQNDRERLASAIRATDLGVWRCDLPLDGQAHYWSPEVRRQFGLSADEPIGVTEFLELLHPEDRVPTSEAMRVAIEDHVPYDVLYRTLGRDGQQRWIHATGNASYRSDGTPYRFDGFTKDLTERIEAEQAKREAKLHGEALLSSTDVGTWSFSVDTGQVTADANLEAMFGMTAEDGATLEAFGAKLHPDDQAKREANLLKTLETGVRYESEFRVLTDAGDRWVVCRGVPTYSDAGTVNGITGVAVDITPQKEAQFREQAALESVRASERRHRFRVEITDALRSAQDVRTIGDTGSRMIGEFLGANRAQYAQLDWRNRTIDVAPGWQNGSPLVEGVFSFEEFGNEIFAMVEGGEVFVVRDSHRDPVTAGTVADGLDLLMIRAFVLVPIMQYNVPIGLFAVHSGVPRNWTDDEVDLIFDVGTRIWDAIRRLTAEAELRILNAELDDKVRHRTSELTRANEELEAFSYSVAHDLRGPLRAINATSKMLLEDLGAGIEPEFREMLDRQAFNARRLGELIDALLNLTRVSRQPLVESDFDLSLLADELQDQLYVGGQAQKGQIVVTPGLTAHGDPGLIRLVLQNLLENACKFSPQGGKVTVGLDAEGRYFVSDQGIGFDMQYADRLFKPFERLVRDRDYPGTGIGLANVRRIIERHGGQVGAISDPPHGSTFWFTLGASSTPHLL